MDRVTRELASLTSALEMFADDIQKLGVTVPPSLQNILHECEKVVKRLESLLEKYSSERLGSRVKHVWSEKDAIAEIQNELTAHQRALAIAIDMNSW
jgi:hypothetical protein